MIVFKQGVRAHGVDGTLWHALWVAHEAFLEIGMRELVVTALRNGAHRTASLHYVGFAADIRSKSIPTAALKQSVLVRIQDALGQEYDVVLEDVSTENEHIHIEFQPKAG